MKLGGRECRMLNILIVGDFFFAFSFLTQSFKKGFNILRLKICYLLKS